MYFHRNNISLLKYFFCSTLLTIFIFFICYNFIDKDIADYIHSVNIPTVVERISKLVSLIFSPEIWFCFFIILSLLCIKMIISKKYNFNIIILTVSLCFVFLITGIMKYCFGRYRPDLFLNNNLYGFNILAIKTNQHSFPSGHTSISITAFLGILNCLHEKKWKIIGLCVTILMTLTISCSRIVLEKHYLSDILVSFYIGIFSFLWIESILHYHYSR